jgi:cysteine-rich repeat protein
VVRTRLVALVIVAAVAIATAGPRPTGGLIAAGRPARRARVLGARQMIGAWHASWDRDTGVPIAMWGSHVDVANSLASPRVAERAARQFLAANLGVLAPGASLADFVVVANRVDRGIRSIGFAQTWHGLRVIDAQIGIVFEHDRLFAVTSSAVPDVQPDALLARSPSQAARAEAWIGTGAHAGAVGDRVVLPIVHGPSDVEYRIADVVDVTAANEHWNVFVAPDGTPIAKRSTWLADTGTVEFNVGVRYAWGAREDAVAPFATVTVDGTPAQTDGSGNVTWTGADPATLVAIAAGSGTEIVNNVSSNASATLSLPNGGATSWNVSNVEFDDAQVSAYIYSNITLARDLTINASAFATNLPVQLIVNNPGSCNGFSDGTSVFLYQASAECENSARVADVVEHEFGHVFHNHSVIPGVGSFTMDQGQDEGIADYNAANINNDSGVGRGLDYTVRPTREIDPVGIERVFPTDLAIDPHISGEILSGALWDLRKAFVAALGYDAGVAKADTIFAGVMQRSPDMPGSYMAALIADDDDGDLGNGVPDQCAIENAFGVHGLVDGYTPTAIGSPSVSGLAIAVPVTPGVSPDGCTPHQVTSITIQWRANDSFFTELQLAQDGGGWTGAFPDEPDNTVIEYSMIVAFDDGSTLQLPSNAADPLYQAFVGTPTPIACAMMDVDPTVALAPPWIASDNDEWAWGSPLGGGAAGDPLAAHTGSAVLGTILGGFDEGYYTASSQTSIAMPAVDVSDYAVVRLQYWRWLSVEDGTFDQASISANGTEVWHNAATASGLTDHVDLEWRFQDVDLTPLVDVNGMVQVSWGLTSDATFELGGWNLDQVCVVGLSKLPKCGDGVLDPDEQCDDGNDFDGDGCSADCKLEIYASGGCATGSPGWLSALPLLLLLGARRRASSRRRPSRTACRNTRAGRADRSRS